MNGIKVYHYALLDDDCTIRVYRSFAAIFHKCINIAIYIFYLFPIMLALCLMLSVSLYAQYVGMMGWFLVIAWKNDKETIGNDMKNKNNR